MGGEVGENIQKIYSYGHRNGSESRRTPSRGYLMQENGDDTFSELNRLELNGGWIQIMGPSERLAEFKEIETTFFAPPATAPALQQLRWPPTNIATTPEEALDRLFMLPGATYQEPVFSWKWEVAPGGIGFVESEALGVDSERLFIGAATPLLGRYLFHFDLSQSREINVDDPRLEDRVADNTAKHEITESESLLIGRNFGVITDIETGPNGNLFVVSLSQGAVYEIFREGGNGDVRTFSAELSGAAEVPGPGDPDGSGTATITLDPSQGEVCFNLLFR
jgi:hypothetical protein